MAATPRKPSTRPSSQAGDEGTETSEDVLDSMDLCGFGCHSEGVAPDAVSVGCEHGTFEVTPQMRVKAAAPAQVEPNVHAQQLHHPAEQVQAPDTSAIGPLLEMVNNLSERLAVMEATVRQLVAIVAPAEEPSGKTEA